VSWDCPYWNNDICELNGITCVPGKGQCVLKGRYEIKTSEKKIEKSDVRKERGEERKEKGEERDM
jgi:hypothetical protein